MPEINDDENLYFIEDETPPEDEVKPDESGTIDLTKLTDEQRRELAMSYINQSDEFVRKDAIKDLIPKPDPKPTEDDDEFADDPYAQRIIERLNKKHQEELNQVRSQSLEVVKPLLAQNAVRRVRDIVNIPDEAAPYLEQLLAQVPAEAYQSGLTEQDAQFLADKAVGQAFREGKLKMGGKVINLMAPEPTSVTNRTEISAEEAKGAEAYFKVTGKKPTVEDLKRAQALSRGDQ